MNDGRKREKTMKQLFKIALIFLRSSKVITITAFIGIFCATILCAGITELSSNAKESYINYVKKNHVDYDISVSKEGSLFSEDELEYIRNIYGVDNAELNDNVIIIWCKDVKIDSKKHIRDVVADELGQYDSSYEINVESKNIRGYENRLRVIYTFLLIVILFVSGLFVISIFNEYMSKYEKDMAVLRTFGGNIKQVNMIFHFMALVLSLAACVAGMLVCFAFGKLILNAINAYFKFSPRQITIDVKSVIIITIFIYLIFNLVVMLFFVRRQNVLPIQVFEVNKTKIKNKKGISRGLIRKIVGTDVYLSYKLMYKKTRHNIIYAIIISLVVMFLYAGSGILSVIRSNMTNMYNDTSKGFDAYGEIWATDYLEPDSISGLNSLIKESSTQSCVLMAAFYDSGKTCVENGPKGFYVTDMDDFMSGFEGETYDAWRDIPKEKRVAVTKETVKYTGYKLGDTITIDSVWLKEASEFTIVKVVNWNNEIWYKAGLLLDIGNLDYSKDKLINNQGAERATIYMNGEHNNLSLVFDEIDRKYALTKNWSEYTGFIREQAIEEIDTEMMQAFGMIIMVLVVLAIVAGIGWFNGVKGILLSRKQEYKVLRMLGTSPSRVGRMCWIQIWSFMIWGLVIGILLGNICLHMALKEEINYEVKIYWEGIAGITLYLFGLTLLLIPTIKKLKNCFS
ncbi:MAG: FtsX-like permease family protein [Lachnospiraceae bacterium]|nr:FtsX-like permease family protein [Lachnospiraceae bacterium]